DLRHAPDEMGLGAVQARLVEAQEAIARVQQLRDDAAASVQAHRHEVARRTADVNPDIERLGLSDGALVDVAARLEHMREAEQELLTQRAALAGLGDLWLARQSAQQRRDEADAHARHTVEA